ncbi:MAG: thiolase family protein [Candidatus Marinimicrobia bacterium]|jgi:acetyl-CoA acetyltransferase|nr:thiolase family protein [Candidatus Neomarinimicrobiota bacterium]MBT3947537.1 thiolase family protein [Candidatus Neomarinimicrobiota bacterium]MBT4064847.1 thiolase family protein [Candidatus Neomarinimicrobiota bacterium]MBT4308457.1 thiolase family protein [Candidatus Neomarinimicrobiota bacterium]MBT4453684.1 thiolase family protein [Candidatus Neomarinimicrobiota bacterium]
MKFTNAHIPYGAYWSTPFCKWQGSFSNLHPLKFAAETARNELEKRHIDTKQLTDLHLGNTVPSKSSFYGAPWVAAMMGAEGITGPMVSQACATSARVIAGAATELESGNDGKILCITADRTSNGPHILYPNPKGPGGKGNAEDWVWDNFNYDPFAKNAMLQTAENVAKEIGISTAQQNEVALLRFQQYKNALVNDGEFHKRFMVSPLEINPSGRKVIGIVKSDEGIFPSSIEGLEKLKPILPDGTVTFGGQTYPADGNAGMIITTPEKANEMSSNSDIIIQLISYAQGRTKKGFMPAANIPACKIVLPEAGIDIADVKAIKTHNPFAVNDIYFAKKMGVKIEDMNNYGSSLVWGHPQGPTGMRLIIELIEELVLLGGGYGLFTGCAAGDTAAAVIIRVDI